MNHLRRFIAGVICPSCGQTDKLVTYQENNISQMECVACHYHKTMDDRDSPDSENSDTQVITIRADPKY